MVPIDKLTFRDIPCANTLQGEAPVKDTIKSPSPKPNKVKPKHKKIKVEIFGLKFKGLLELQYTLGISFIFKNIQVIISNFNK